jgi:DNA-directed RNA polymerase subunit H
MAKRVLLPKVVTAHTTALTQLRARGYDVSDYEGASVQEISAMLENKQLAMTVSAPDGSKVMVVFHVAKALRPPNVEDYVEQAYHTTGMLGPDDELIIVSKDSPNDTVNKHVDGIWTSDKKYVAVRSLDSLQFDVLKHKLVPAHRVLSTDEVEKVRQTYHMTSNKQFPDMSRIDPVALALGMKPGRVVEIVRPSRTAVSSLYYRKCV